MDPEKTYRVDHIFRPLTAQQVNECYQKLECMEKQFLKEVEKHKIADKDSKTRSKLNIDFEELPMEDQLSM